MSRIELAQLATRYDVMIVGGGITGAGIAREAARSGASVLLVEQADFASGTSSWSSKLVHGGLRYLKNGQWRLTLESVRERQRLLDQAPGLVEPLRFLMPIYRGIKPGKLTMRFGLWLYDRMAGKAASRWLSAAATLSQEPDLRRANLRGAVSYLDARTDDARLVLRLLLEAADAGATVRNYTRATLRVEDGRTCGAILTDALDGKTRQINADVVINASGAWADQLPGASSGQIKLRPLRGSHLVFAAKRLPIQQAVSWLHPRDQRPVFAHPWEGAVVYGTTDLDHDGDLAHPRMRLAEADYLIEGLRYQFPELGLSAKDALSAYAGVRPVVDGGKDDPSAESRESAMWSSAGLVNITGGKLTTFRVTAREVLHEAAKQLPKLAPRDDQPVFAAPLAAHSDLHRRLFGRLGERAASALLKQAAAEEIESIGDTAYCWAELRWAARHERVCHLDDLLMRRTRIGLVMTEGGREILPRVKTICMDELGWDGARWDFEMTRYRDYWQQQHRPPVA